MKSSLLGFVSGFYGGNKKPAFQRAIIQPIVPPLKKPDMVGVISHFKRLYGGPHPRWLVKYTLLALRCQSLRTMVNP